MKEGPALSAETQEVLADVLANRPPIDDVDEKCLEGLRVVKYRRLNNTRHGKILRDQLLARGWTLRAIDAETGIPFQTLGDWSRRMPGLGDEPEGEEQD
jgi:hypothetical protein